jgi:hypothetical protein
MPQARGKQHLRKLDSVIGTGVGTNNNNNNGGGGGGGGGGGSADEQPRPLSFSMSLSMLESMQLKGATNRSSRGKGGTSAPSDGGVSHSASAAALGAGARARRGGGRVVAETQATATAATKSIQSTEKPVVEGAGDNDDGEDDGDDDGNGDGDGDGDGDEGEETEDGTFTKPLPDRVVEDLASNLPEGMHAVWQGQTNAQRADRDTRKASGSRPVYIHRHASKALKAREASRIRDRSASVHAAELDDAIDQSRAGVAVEFYMRIREKAEQVCPITHVAAVIGTITHVAVSSVQSRMSLLSSVQSRMSLCHRYNHACRCCQSLLALPLLQTLAHSLIISSFLCARLSPPSIPNTTAATTTVTTRMST